MSLQRILLVDDDMSLSAAVKIALENRYTIAAVNTAFRGMKYLSEHKVDLVLLDIKLPNISGMDALRVIKEIQPETPVTMLTAYSSEENKKIAHELGAHGFIVKPFELDYLRHYVEDVLSR